ncbi:MAG: hypothetical protein GF384_05105, partial [Elusimicrobia bacterium]|nr:hypothetical protein [Elusimicrobiota bacterium]MBD3412169.1 hypothetical protein [Elusimicrobiota bacterium]
MQSCRIQKTRVVIQQGDIALMLVDGLVSPDTTDVWMQRGVAAAIARSCNVSIREEIDDPRPIPIGEVVVTSAGKLPARH